MNPLRLFTLNSDFRFKLSYFIVFSFLFFSLTSMAISIDYDPPIDYSSWGSFENTVRRDIKLDNIRGHSEIWTGAIALVAGVVGDTLSKDPMEKGVYSLFQTIGVASIGLGLYDAEIGSENRKIYQFLGSAGDSLSTVQKDLLIRNYYKIDKSLLNKEKNIKMITFSLIALTQLYNANRMTNESVKNTLAFIGAVNALVAISYAF